MEPPRPLAAREGGERRAVPRHQVKKEAVLVRTHQVHTPAPGDVGKHGGEQPDIADRPRSRRRGIRVPPGLTLV